jgi:antirestriction protein ArdC
MKTTSAQTADHTDAPAVAPGGARADVYTRVTERIVAALEAGTRPWSKPWTDAGPQAQLMPLRHNGTPYRGVNVLLLWAQALECGYSLPVWMTYKQAQALGGQVRKGEHGSLVVFANRVTRCEADEDGIETEKEVAFMKGYTVFNVEQIDGLPQQYLPPSVSSRPAFERIDAAERFFANTGARVFEGGDRAYYAPGPDCIRLPLASAFKDAQSHAATKAHEFIHWTGHASRLARGFGAKGYAREAYATEELVAELGAAFLCADLGIADEPRADHAAYLASWLQALRNDKRLIFKAAGHAQRAADYLHGLQPKAHAE